MTAYISAVRIAIEGERRSDGTVFTHEVMRALAEDLEHAHLRPGTQGLTELWINVTAPTDVSAEGNDPL